MKKNTNPGLFIVFEGLDGSGSSTQVDLLTSRLNQIGYYAYATKEPTNNLIGGLIRSALKKDWKPSGECLQLLFTADRAHHLTREIIPNLEKAHIVVSDRYFFSTIAFGSVSENSQWLEELNQRFLIPDITFLIRVSPKECVRRIGKSRNEFELFEEEKKLQKTWSTYSSLAKRKEFPTIIIDGEKTIKQIEGEIFRHVENILKKKKDLNVRSKNLFNHTK